MFNEDIPPFLTADQTPFGVVPARKTLINCYKKFRSEKLAMERKIQLSIGGRILRIDHTFKVAKLCKIKGQYVFKAVFEVMNEHNEIVAYWLTTSKSVPEMKLELEKV